MAHRDVHRGKNQSSGKQALGREGEQRAARYLAERGYRIVAANVRAARVEMDLIARRGPLLVFVEVKTRRASGRDGFGHHGAAAEAVDARKQARLRRGAQAWLDAHPEERRRAGRVRFDVVTCVTGVTGVSGVSGDVKRERGDRADQDEAPNETTAPRREARWSIEHWEAAF